MADSIDAREAVEQVYQSVFGDKNMVVAGDVNAESIAITLSDGTDLRNLLQEFFERLMPDVLGQQGEMLDLMKDLRDRMESQAAPGEQVRSDVQAVVLDLAHERERKKEAKAGDRPNLTAYMVDRVKLLAKLGKAVREQNDHAGCVLLGVFRGNQEESHDRLKERIARKELPKMLGMSEGGVTHIYVPWSEMFDKSGDLETELTSALGKAVGAVAQGGSHGQNGVSMYSPKSDIERAIAQNPRPVVLYFNPMLTGASATAAPGHFRAVLEAFVRYWEQWDASAMQDRLIVMLAVRYGGSQVPRGLLGRLGLKKAVPVEDGLDQAFETFDSYPDDRVLVRILPKLEGIRESDVITWREEAEGASWKPPSQEEIARIFREHRDQTGSDVMPMSVIGPRLSKLIHFDHN